MTSGRSMPPRRRESGEFYRTAREEWPGRTSHGARAATAATFSAGWRTTGNGSGAAIPRGIDQRARGDGRLGAVRYAEALEDGGARVLHGAGGDAELPPDLPVRETL